MPFLKKQFNCYCYWPSNPKSIVEFIGGSYLARRPDLTYKRFIQNLIKNNYAVHAYEYLPQFDHQELSKNAWKDFRSCKNSLFTRINTNI